MERASKYGAKKTQDGGRTFDSKAEARRFNELSLLVLAGEVLSIECQPRFMLQESFKKNGKTHRAIEYIADFRVLYKDGHEEIEDVKGMQTEVFKIKRKLFEKRYPNLTLKIV